MIRKRKIKRNTQKRLKIRRCMNDSEVDNAGPRRSSSSSADETNNARQRIEFSTHRQRMSEAAKQSEKIQIFDFGASNFAVFTGVDLLLRHFRFLCHSIHRPKNELVTELPSVPVVLLPEQTQLLLENGFAKLRRMRKAGERQEKEHEESDEPGEFEPLPPPLLTQNVAYVVKLTVFRDLWRKGFYLADGAKFGCDYLAYRRPPPEQHSEFMVLCSDANANDGVPPFRPLSLIGVSRASTQVRKRILLAIVSVGSPVPYYLEMNWWKGDEE